MPRSEDNEKFHDTLKRLIDEYVHAFYDVSENFPKDEIFGARSQERRAAMSVMLNYIEGYSRQYAGKELKCFLKTAFGSLKESEYVAVFAEKRDWIEGEESGKLLKKADRISGMLWSTIHKIKE